MASEQLQVDIISPSGKTFSHDRAEMVIIPGDDGDRGILVGHADTIIALRPGVLWFYSGGKLQEKIFVGGGFADITPHKIVVLATTATPVARLDQKATEQEIKQWEAEAAKAMSKPASGKDPAPASGVDAMAAEKLAVARAALAAMADKTYS